MREPVMPQYCRLCLCWLLICGAPAWAFAPPKPYPTPAMRPIPPGQYGALVRLGQKIFNDTPRYAGRYTGNALSCTNCHLDGGRKPYATPMWGAVGLYPKFQARSQQTITFDQRLQQCFISSLHGIEPPLDSQTILALAAYSHFISHGVPTGALLPGADLPHLPPTGRAPDPLHGKVLFASHCAMCHGAHGQGTRNPQTGTYTFPPLWGIHSFAHGAKLAKVRYAARFIWENMPYQNGQSLTVQQARDIAAWVDLQWRPPNPRQGLLGWLP